MRQIILDDLNDDDDKNPGSKISGQEAATAWEQTFWKETFTTLVNESPVKFSDDLARLWFEIETKVKISQMLHSAANWLREKEDSLNPTKIISREKKKSRELFEESLRLPVRLEDLGYLAVCKIAVALDINVRHSQGKKRGQFLSEQEVFQLEPIKELEDLTYEDLSLRVITKFKIIEAAQRDRKSVTPDNFDPV